MNPALFHRAFPFMGMSPSQVSSIQTTTATQAALQKSMWTSSPLPFTHLPHLPTMWPQCPPWMIPLQQPLFSLADLDTVLYGYMQRADEISKGIAISSLQLPLSPMQNGSNVHTSALSRFRQENTGSSESEPTDLPPGLATFHAEIFGIPQYGIIAKTEISKGTRFGPYRGRIVQTSEIKANDDCSVMWEVFDDGKLSHYVDGRNHNGVASWMSMVQCARYPSEQNLEVIQQDGEIYYQTTREILPQSELLVWYSHESYDSYFGIPIALKSDKASESVQRLYEESVEGQGFSCERCGKMFTYKYYLDKHLKFTRCVDLGNRGYPCPVCDRSFEKRDRLRIHILHVHEKYKPHVCAACGKAFSQSSSLNKHIRVHTGQRPYKCVHCAKTFTASSILRTHIRQHSGEKPFKCKFCGKSFASHAAHDSHVRRTHTLPTRTVDEEDDEETGALLVDV